MITREYTQTRYFLTYSLDTAIIRNDDSSEVIGGDTMNYLEMTFGQDHRTAAAYRDNPNQSLEQFEAKTERRNRDDLEIKLQIANDEIDRRRQMSLGARLCEWFESL